MARPKEVLEECIRQLARWEGENQRKIPLETFCATAQRCFPRRRDLMAFYDFMVTPEGKHLARKWKAFEAWKVAIGEPRFSSS